MPPDEAAKIRLQFADIAAARRPFERLENVNLHKGRPSRGTETSAVPASTTTAGLWAIAH